MAALDSFRSFNELLKPEQREILRETILRTTNELLVLRSEDARKRLVEQYMHEVNELQPGRK